MRVLIVGSGIAGQTLACSLAKRGIECRIVELKSDFQILGSGMYVQNNALRALLDIGVTEEIVARGWHAPDHTSLIADRGGAVLATSTIPPIPGYNLPGTNPIARPVLHEILHAAVEQAQIPLKMGTTVTELRNSDRSCDVVFSDGSEETFDLVVGADGIRSKVRDLVFGEVTPEYSGFSNWRATLPRSASVERVIWQIGDGKSFGIIPISDHEVYIAGVSKEPGNPRFEKSGFVGMMRERFAEFGGPAHELMNAITTPDQIIYTPIEEVTMPRPWSKGRVVVLGDAAHASTPFWAQGASMAIEDTVLLAQLLERKPIEEALVEWEDRRVPRCLFVQEGSKNAGVRGHREGVVEEIYAYIRQNAQADTARRYEFFYQPI
jgi:2-polyprenyl-6-methoxyphenol hydroxylase-like FAD-dependent oxidoreductase